MANKTKQIIVTVEPDRKEAFKIACRKLRTSMSRELDLKISEVLERYNASVEGREG